MLDRLGLGKEGRVGDYAQHVWGSRETPVGIICLEKNKHSLSTNCLPDTPSHWLYEQRDVPYIVDEPLEAQRWGSFA